MTTTYRRGMPRHPRPSRAAALLTPDLLRRWASTVRRVETGPVDPADCCPSCDPDEGLDARDVLGSVIRRGGRRGRRVAAALAPLDARFVRATSPAPGRPPEERWWRGRLVS